MAKDLLAFIYTYHLIAILILPPNLPSTHRLNFLALLPRADRYDMRLREPPQISCGSILPARAFIRLCSQFVVVFRIFPPVNFRVSSGLPIPAGSRKCTYGFLGSFCNAELSGASTVVFCSLSFKRLEMLSISRVKPAKMLMTRSFPITSDMLRPFEPPEEASSPLEGGTRMLGIFMIGSC